MTFQATHGGLSPNGKIDLKQIRNMKSAYSMKLCHMETVSFSKYISHLSSELDRFRFGSTAFQQ